MNKLIIKIVSFILMICALTCSMFSCFIFESKESDASVCKLSDKLVWLKEADADKVVRVGVLHYVHGIHPAVPMDCYYSSDRSEIVDFIDFYKNLEIEEADSSEIEDLLGGGKSNVVFTYSDGNSSTICLTQGYLIIGSQVFECKISDGFDYKKMFDRYSRLEYDKVSKVYTNTEDAMLIGETDSVADFRFKATEADADSYVAATHYIELEFGKIYILSERKFCIDTNKSIKYYELAEWQSFRDFLTDNSVINK